MIGREGCTAPALNHARFVGMLALPSGVASIRDIGAGGQTYQIAHCTEDRATSGVDKLDNSRRMPDKMPAKQARPMERAITRCPC